MAKSNDIIDIHSREELIDFLQKIIDESEIPDIANKILSQPSGEYVTFFCRQYDPHLSHRQQVIRVFHN